MDSVGNGCLFEYRAYALAKIDSVGNLGQRGEQQHDAQVRVSANDRTRRANGRENCVAERPMLSQCKFGRRGGSTGEKVRVSNIRKIGPAMDVAGLASGHFPDASERSISPLPS